MKLWLILTFLTNLIRNVLTSDLDFYPYTNITARSDEDSEFSYHPDDPNGPEFWPGTCKYGKRQSPIVLFNKEVERKFTIPMLGPISGFNKRPTSVNVKNEGHGVVFSFNFNDGVQPQISGGALGSDVYNFVSFHMHWPCEHPFPKCVMETHLVHFNSKYGSLAEAINQEDGLAVIGLLYQESEHARTLPFMSIVDEVMRYNQSYTESNPGKIFGYNDVFRLRLAPKYYTYKGSLTTPPCSEAVTWNVVTSPLKISSRDLETLRKLADKKGRPIEYNNRPVQDLNNRTIYVYSPK